MLATVDVRAEGGSLEVALAGEIDLSNANTIHREIENAMGNRTTSIQVDLSEVRYLDSSGLRVLFELAEKARTLDTSFQVMVADGSPLVHVLDTVAFAQVADVRFDQMGNTGE